MEGGTALAEFTVTDAAGEVIEAWTLDPQQYAAWVDWTDPVSGTSMGTPRGAGEGIRGSPRFAEMVINAPKSLSTSRDAEEMLADVFLPEESAMLAERREVLEHAIAALPDRMRSIIVDVYIHERPVKDIAEQLGVTHGAISQQRSAAIGLLRDALEAFDMGNGEEQDSKVSASSRREYLSRVKARFSVGA